MAQSAITDLTLGVTTGDTPDVSDVTQRALESGAIFGGLMLLADTPMLRYDEIISRHKIDHSLIPRHVPASSRQ